MKSKQNNIETLVFSCCISISYVKRLFTSLLILTPAIEYFSSNCTAEHILCGLVEKMRGIPYFDLPGGSDGKESPAALETGMATHSSILAWRTPETGGPSGLWSMGSKKVRYY